MASFATLIISILQPTQMVEMEVKILVLVVVIEPITHCTTFAKSKAIRLTDVVIALIEVSASLNLLKLFKLVVLSLKAPHPTGTLTPMSLLT